LSELEDPRTQAAFGRLSQGHAAKAALDLLADDLLGQQRTLDLAIFTKLESGVVLTAEEALQQWHRKYAVYHLVKMLGQKLAAGASAGRVLEPMMNGAVPNG
jgi:hypothetical protein